MGNILNGEKNKRDGANNRDVPIHDELDDYPEFLIKFAKVLMQKSHEEEHSKLISKATFQKYVCKGNLALGNHLFHHFLMEEDSPEDMKEPNEEMSQMTFIKQANELFGLHTDSMQLNYYMKIFTTIEEKISYDDLCNFITTAYEVAQLACNSPASQDDLMLSITKSVMHGKEEVGYNYAYHWLCEHSPKLVSLLHRYISHVMTVGYSVVDKEEVYEKSGTPILDKATFSSCVSLHPALIWMLSCTLPSVYTEISRTNRLLEGRKSITQFKVIEEMVLAHTPTHWVPLYNSDNDGLSINRFKHHVFDYHSPTLMFVTTDCDQMYCIAVDEEWRDSKHYFGGLNSMCIQLLPTYRLVEKGNNILYFNISYRGLPTGLEVGSDSSNRVITIDKDMNLVHFRKVPYKLKSLEVWGCGTALDMETQRKKKIVALCDAERRQKVKVNPGEWLDNPDRYLLELSGSRPTYANFEKPRSSFSQSNSSIF